MTWQNPVAWLGVMAIALPIAIHLLGRGHARVYRFPSLRFFQASRLLPTRRTTIHDPLLLAVRCAILLGAAGALAQPLLGRARRRADVERRLSRAIVVDTSASIGGALDTAVAAARRAVAGADANVTLMTSTPAAGVRSAVAWLARQAGRRELIVISDFARGVIDTSALADVPRGYGLRLIPVGTSITRSANISGLRGDSAIGTHVDVARDSISVRWAIGTAGGAASTAGEARVRVLGAPTEVAQATIAMRAAREIGVPATYDPMRRIAIVLPGYPALASLSGNPPRTGWMIDVLTRIQAESPTGEPVRAAQQDSGAQSTLLLFCDTPPTSVRCASLMASVLRANATDAPLSELEPERMSDAELSHWTRAPSAGTDGRRPGDWLTGPSDGRWLWGLVLLLLGIETLVRRDRARRAATPRERVHDIAA